MERLKRLVCFALVIFILGGIFLNSGFVAKRQDEAYAQLKEKYAVEEIPVTEVQEVVDEQNEETEVEQQEQQEQQEPEVTEEVQAKTENRTTENIIWDFLKENGYSDIQTAAIIGNLYQESGLNSSRVEYGSGEGIGLVQWSFGRKESLKNYCKNKGVEWTDLTAQLEFLVKELKSSQFYEPYKSTFSNPYSINEATEAYCWGFERPNAKKANMSYRKNMAWQTYYRNVDR